jgi:hypothetical protein
MQAFDVLRSLKAVHSGYAVAVRTVDTVVSASQKRQGFFQVLGPRLRIFPIGSRFNVNVRLELELAGLS